jgi:four helix bundle protein
MVFKSSGIPTLKKEFNMVKVNHNFKKLKIWQEATEMVVLLYEEVSNYPQEEKYGLVSQIRRASVSIAANIAEGSARGSNPDFIRFLYISKGSLAEVITLLTVASRLNITKQSKTETIIEKLMHLNNSIYSFIKTLNKPSRTIS